jgi:uncharacterized protein (DUF433 family)
MEYVEQRNGGYYVAGTRVSLDSVVYGFLRGESAEEIAYNFEALTLEQVSGAIAYYHENRPIVDVYLEQQRKEYDRLYEEARAKDPAFYAKLDAAREATPSRRG